MNPFFDTPTTKPATERAELEELRRVCGVGDDRDTLVTGRVSWRRGVRQRHQLSQVVYERYSL